MKAEFSSRHRFADWPNAEVPIWDGDQFIYCGMSGRALGEIIEASKKKQGLTTRLHSHAGGRLSGDQFCVYVANRLIVPALKESDLPRFASGDLTLDSLTKKYIRERF